MVMIEKDEKFLGGEEEGVINVFALANVYKYICTVRQY